MSGSPPNHTYPVDSGNEPRDRFDSREVSGSEKTSFASMEDYYRHVLGVTGAAGAGEIKNAYRSLLSKNHPDKVDHLDSEFQDLASRRTKEIIEAYEYLRSMYRFD